MIRYGGLVFPDRWGAGACDFADDRPARAVRSVPTRRKDAHHSDDGYGAYDAPCSDPTCVACGNADGGKT